METNNYEQYFQCPYCPKYDGGHEIRVPKSVGKYRVKIVYGNILSFICNRCGRIFKIEINPHLYMWEFMKKKQREHFKKLKEVKIHGKKIRIKRN